MKKETGKQITKEYNKSISGDLIGDIRSLTETARHNVAIAVNASLTILYWQIGSRIRQDILKEKRAGYGEAILPTLSAKLVPEFGNGFGIRNLSRMIRFAEVFPERKIVSTLSIQLSWSHFLEIITLKDDLQRDFYAEMCRIEHWSVRTLRKKIDGMLYERTAISKKPEKLIEKDLAALREEDRLTPDLVFRDPYFLDFLGLKDTYSEKDLETAILREMESFILELGAGFSFVARQKRITVDNEDYYLDLLFFHRKLKRLIAIELKLSKFRPAYKGQMELYLRWLEKYGKEPGEETPLGLILCAGKTSEQIELLQLDKSGIKVAEYMTELPKRELLEQKLHKAVELARKRLEAKPV
ncbi:MAG: PDDEXK nuclease domain-containing protein [Syntrophales bacterium]|nr:PDDEXK nuclease domain-containing protein [Syntrophales bacterium]